MRQGLIKPEYVSKENNKAENYCPRNTDVHSNSVIFIFKNRWKFFKLQIITHNQFRQPGANVPFANSTYM